MDTAKWPQGIGFVNKPPMEGSRSMLEREAAARAHKDRTLNCPRCNSTNTKFCYYNNYSLSQPRYFCKTCRRYWTEGGSLRNVPVGGGSRKNKRSSLSSSAAASQPLSKKFVDFSTPSSFPESAAPQDPKIHEAGQDLNLAYPPTEDFSSLSKLAREALQPAYDTEDKGAHNQNTTNASSHHLTTATELLKTAISSRGFTSFLSIPTDSNATYPTGFPLQEFKPSLNFSLEGFESTGYGSLQQGVQATGARLFFPVGGVMKQQIPSTTSSFDQNRGGQGEPTTGYWTGLLGGGSW